MNMRGQKGKVRLTIQYPGSIDSKFERALCQAAGKKPGGLWFSERRCARFLDWYFSDKRKAIAAMERICGVLIQPR